MEALCKTCCNGICPLQGAKDRSVLFCNEYIPGLVVSEGTDIAKDCSKKEIELRSEINSLKMQNVFLKAQVKDTNEMFINAAKESLALAREYEKDNEKLKEENAELKRQLDSIDYWKSQVQRLCGEKFNLEKESEELKSTIKAMVEEMAKVGEICDCINSKACPLDECGKFTFHDKIMKLIKED